MSIFNFIFSLKLFLLIQLSSLIFAVVIPSVDMFPSSLFLHVGATSRIQATAKDDNGQPAQDVPTQWSTRNSNVATVDRTGNITSISIGAITQESCTPFTTVSEGDLFPGGIVSFGVSGGAGSVTVDHVNAGTGFQSFTLVSATNAVVNIPAFAPGTYVPVTATFMTTNPALPVDFTLRAASAFHAANIRVRCGVVTPTPTPTPGGSGKIKGGFGVEEVNFNLNGNYQNPFEDVKIRVTWTAPDSSIIVTNGFYYNPGVYKARFAPNQSGTWNWSASIIENNGIPSQQTGSLLVGQQISDGFVKRHPTNNFQWLNDTGTPFNPIGISR
jgi:hypothetical protein